MALVKVWRVWSGALPNPPVYLSEATAQAAVDEALQRNPDAFVRVKEQWALARPDGGLILLPEDCEERDPDELVP